MLTGSFRTCSSSQLSTIKLSSAGGSSLHFLDVKFVHHDILALCLLVLICFAVGLLIRTETGTRIGDWLEQDLLGRIPGFPLIRGMIRQFAGEKDLWQ